MMQEQEETSHHLKQDDELTIRGLKENVLLKETRDI